MRPRVFPAEDALFCKRCRNNVDASMRPRVFPAEDAGWIHYGEIAIELQ